MLLDNLGHVANAMGNTDQARGYFRDALPKAWAVSSPPLVLDVLVGLAKAESGADSERAASWAALIATHPSAYQDTKQKATELLDALSATLPADARGPPYQLGSTAPLNLVRTNSLTSGVCRRRRGS